MSIEEAENLFESDEDRMCVPTDYASKSGAHVRSDYKDGKPTCAWWLRTYGDFRFGASMVESDGSVEFLGRGNWRDSRDGSCVRPVLWMSLDSSIHQPTPSDDEIKHTSITENENNNRAEV